MTDFILPEDCCVSLIKLNFFLNTLLAGQATYSTGDLQQSSGRSPLRGLRVFLKNFQVDERWCFYDYSYLCKGLK
jgi:hypothetical protein